MLLRTKIENHLEDLIHSSFPAHRLHQLLCQVLLNSQPLGHYLSRHVSVNWNSWVSEPGHHKIEIKTSTSKAVHCVFLVSHHYQTITNLV